MCSVALADPQSHGGSGCSWVWLPIFTEKASISWKSAEQSVEDGLNADSVVFRQHETLMNTNTIYHAKSLGDFTIQSLISSSNPFSFSREAKQGQIVYRRDVWRDTEAFRTAPYGPNITARKCTVFQRQRAESRYYPITVTYIPLSRVMCTSRAVRGRLKTGDTRPCPPPPGRGISELRRQHASYCICNHCSVGQWPRTVRGWLNHHRI